MEAFQKEDVSAYMGLNTAVNNSSAMTEHKHKQAVICEQEHGCTSFHSDTHTPYLQRQPSQKYTWPHIRIDVQSTKTHCYCIVFWLLYRKFTDVQTGVKSWNSPNVWQHIRAEPKQPVATWSEKTASSSEEFTKKIQTPPNVCLQSLPGVQEPSQLFLKTERLTRATEYTQCCSKQTPNVQIYAFFAEAIY